MKEQFLGHHSIIGPMGNKIFVGATTCIKEKKNKWLLGDND